MDRLDIKTTGDTDTSVLSTEKTICLICKKQFSRYSCPKCAVKYCSVLCYKAHSENCVELFQQQNVIEGLKSMTVTNEQKDEMMNILKRQQEVANEEEAANDSSLISEELLEKLERGEDVFDLLSPEQKKDFLRALEDGRISSELPLWSPWWNADVFISELRGEGRGGAGAAPIAEGAPPIPASLPPLSTLTKQPPSPLLIYNLADILYAYALVMRLSNGEWQPEPGEAASDVVRLSAVLSGNAVFHSLQEALNSSLATVKLKLAPRHICISILRDVSLILRKKNFVLAALSDLSEIFRTAEESVAPKAKKTLQLTQRKAFFYLLWAHEQPQEAFSLLSAGVQTVFAEQEKLLISSSSAASAPAPPPSLSPPSIEELPPSTTQPAKPALAPSPSSAPKKPLVTQLD